MRTKTAARLGAIVALALFAGLVTAVRDPAPSAASDGRYSADIRRTQYGIPHITAKDHGSLGYGYGYAFAQDNLCVLASWMVTLRGERSRHFGPGALSDDPVRPIPNLASDVYHRSLRESGLLRRLLARPAPLGPTPELRRLVDGYAAGYNRYLADTGVDRLPDPSCRGKAWVTPITADDIWINLLDLNRMAGSTGLKEAIAAARPDGGAAPGEAPDKGPDQATPKPKPAAPGSNGWALGRAATTAKNGMLLADPHFPWNGIRRFYQVQLTIPGVLNVAGGSLYGTPLVQIGHNASLAWTHTVSHAQRFTLYRLKLVPGDPTTYLVDGRAEPMGRQEVTVPTRRDDGSTAETGTTLYTSRYGPVISWSGEAAYALADANVANLRSGNEWLAMAAARDVAGLRTAQRAYQSMPFVYTLATDTAGTAYFSDVSVVPHVTDAQAERCAVPEGERMAPGTYVLDGSTSDCLWGKDPDAVEPGVFGPGNAPAMTRADYVANSNESPWLTNPEAPLTGYPRIYGDTETRRDLRTRLSLDMIGKRLSGRDGFGPSGFTLASLQAVTLGKRNLGAEITRADLLALCRDRPVITASDGERVNVKEACRTLARWKARAGLGDEGAVLWREFFQRLDGPRPRPRAGESEPPPVKDWWRVPFDPERPLTTPHGLDRDHPNVSRALADAVQYFRKRELPLTLMPGKAQHYGSVPVPGCTEGEGCFDRVRTGGPLGDDGRYPDVNTGSSFLMAVELTPAGPRARTILTYSLSADPTNPHHTDQTVLFSQGKWVTNRFTEAEIMADPALRVTRLRG
ncbi:penicillin acylase family protein [Spongiactinospora sp. TRM90649]|uniref:penicillin acylase family protein n=1 Tax=Spongiactinospora sp. TRM90649 TaxID=3031114 RepID=UPI0023F6C371|nr:penicillin acylase family protein [Spongiactinospora sp. TRM90649]MDF5755462.1 penicillin acylase family protein [Spongiactinospora sp. TRM90649]